MAPIDLISCLISDELSRRSERLLDRRRKQAEFRDAHKTLDQFDFNFNPKMNRSLVFDLATNRNFAAGAFLRLIARMARRAPLPACRAAMLPGLEFLHLRNEKWGS
jgi:hypothetical protein